MVSEEKNFKEFIWSPQCKKPPPYSGHVFRRIKISQISFEKGHQSNNPVKLFQNLTSGFRGEKFWRIYLKSRQWKKPLPPWRPYFLNGSNIHQQFLKRVTQGTIIWNYFKIKPGVWEKKIFKEFLHVHSAKSPPPPSWQACFATDQNFANNFRNGSPKEQSCDIILKSNHRKIFKEFLKKFHFVAMTTWVFDGIKFCEHFLQRTTQGTFLPSLVQIGPAV